MIDKQKRCISAECAYCCLSIDTSFVCLDDAVTVNADGISDFYRTILTRLKYDAVIINEYIRTDA